MHGDTTDTDMYFFRLRILLINELKSIYNILHCFLKGQDVFGKKTDILDSWLMRHIVGKKNTISIAEERGLYLFEKDNIFLICLAWGVVGCSFLLCRGIKAYTAPSPEPPFVWIAAPWGVCACSCGGESWPPQLYLLRQAFVVRALEGCQCLRGAVSFVCPCFYWRL